MLRRQMSFVLVDLQSLADDVPTTPLETRIQLLTRRLLKGKHASLTAAVQLPILGNSSSRLTIQLTISNSQSTQPNSSVRCSQHAVNEVVLSGGMGASQQVWLLVTAGARKTGCTHLGPESDPRDLCVLLIQQVGCMLQQAVLGCV